MGYESLPAAAQVAYAELLDALLEAPPPARGVSVFTRTVKGRRYWYLQYVVGSSKRSFYLGPDDEPTRARIEELRRRRSEDRAERSGRERLVATGVAAGLWAPTAAEGRVYEALVQSGIFAVGGVLVGTHAFLNLGNVLGVRWVGGAGRTEDIDVAHDPSLEVAAPDDARSLPEELERADPRFLPVPALDPRSPSTSFRIRGRRLSVSMLTPARGRPDGQPVRIASLGVAAEPVRFLDYLLAGSQLAAVPTGAGALIRLPAPARFALHKLVVAARRPPAMATRARKDLAQAAAVLGALLEQRPGDVVEGAGAARAMGKRFNAQLRAGFERLEPRLQASVGRLLPEPDG